MVSNAAASPSWARRMASLRVTLSGLRGPLGGGGVWLGSDTPDLGTARSLTRVRPRRAVLSGPTALQPSATLRELCMESQAIRCSVFLIQQFATTMIGVAGARVVKHRSNGCHLAGIANGSGLKKLGTLAEARLVEREGECRRHWSDGRANKNSWLSVRRGTRWRWIPIVNPTRRRGRWNCC